MTVTLDFTIDNGDGRIDDVIATHDEYTNESDRRCMAPPHDSMARTNAVGLEFRDVYSNEVSSACSSRDKHITRVVNPSRSDGHITASLSYHLNPWPIILPR